MVRVYWRILACLTSHISAICKSPWFSGWFSDSVTPHHHWVCGRISGGKPTNCMGHWPCGILRFYPGRVWCAVGLCSMEHWLLLPLLSRKDKIRWINPETNTLEKASAMMGKPLLYHKHISVGEIPTLLVTDLILSNISPWYPINYNWISADPGRRKGERARE